MTIIGNARPSTASADCVQRITITGNPFAVPSSHSAGHSSEHLWSQGKWPASWIDAEQIAVGSPSVTLYKRVFTLQEATSFQLHVSADERYELWLNGQRIGRGPERGDLQNWFFESYAVSLPAGEHVLIARTWWLGAQAPAPYAQVQARSGFLCATVGVPQDLLTTGTASWLAQRLTAYQWIAPAMTWGAGVKARIDGASFPWGWECGVGDGWHPTHTVVRAASGDGTFDGCHIWWLRPATLPAMSEVTLHAGRCRHLEAITDEDTSLLRVHASASCRHEVEDWDRLLSGQASLTIPQHAKRRVIVDLDTYLTAYTELTLSGGAGASVRINWAESLFLERGWGYGEKGQRDQIEGKLFAGVGYEFIADGGQQRRFDGLWWEAGRYLEIIIQANDQALTIDNLQFRQTGYPLAVEGTFFASDKRLEDLAPLALRTLQACMHETYMDCPYYEQLMYIGDTRLEVLTTYALSSDDRLPRKAVFIFDVSRTPDGLTQSRYPHFHRQVIPPFSLWWVAMVHDFSQWRDDLAFVRARMPGVRAVIDYFVARLNADRLIVAPSGWNFIDWVSAWKNGVPEGGNEGGISGPLNWQLAWNLRLASELEELIGEPELAARGRRIARQVAEAADATFWDEGRGLYADDLAHTSYSEHSQCLALLSGLAPEKRFSRLANGLLADQHLHRCTLYFSHYLFETLCLIGHAEGIIERLEVWFNHHALGMKTLLEMPEPSRSDCHAWAAHPLFQYGATFLGVRPAAPGFASVIIAPQLGTLTWASGTVAHPKGPIQVALKRHGERLSAVITLPPGLTGTLVYAGVTHHLTAGSQTLEVTPANSPSAHVNETLSLA